jgi:thioredoxin
MGDVQVVDEAAFAQAISAGPVVVDFYTPYCPPCRQLQPALEDVAKTLDGRVRFVKVNLIVSPELGDRLGVTTVPTLMIFRDGEEQDRKVGAPSRPALERWVRDHTA